MDTTTDTTFTQVEKLTMEYALWYFLNNCKYLSDDYPYIHVSIIEKLTKMTQD